MTKARADSTFMLPNAPRPTYDDLITHFNRYGLDNAQTGYRHAPERYRNYERFANDSLVQVAYDYLGTEAYVALVEAVGYGNFKKQAREDKESQG